MPVKGTAHYYHIEVDGMKNENAAWYYPEPSQAEKRFRGALAFGKGVRSKCNFAVIISWASRFLEDCAVVHHEADFLKFIDVL